MKLNAQQLRDLEEQHAIGEVRTIRRNPIYFILENIYDTYNIGGLFRLADALAIEKMYLCGDTEIPPNSRIKKASIGTYKVVDWQYKKTVKEAISEVRKRKMGVETGQENRRMKLEKKPTSNIQLPNPHPYLSSKFYNKISIIAVEQHPSAIDYRKASYSLPLALIFGNESYGVLPETLKLADRIVEIPMWGINKSLNVIVSAAIVSYFAASKL